MNTLTEPTLRRLLQEHILEPFQVIQTDSFETELEPNGNALSHRDSYRRDIEGRLARLRAVAPKCTDIHEQHLAVIRALEAIEPTEHFYYWTARTQTREYFGASTCHRMVSCFSYSLSSDVQK